MGRGDGGSWGEEDKELGEEEEEEEERRTAEDDGYHEERACQVAPEGDEPVQQHPPDGQPAVEDGDGRVLRGSGRSRSVTRFWRQAGRVVWARAHHECPGAEVGAGQDDQHQTVGKDEGAQEPGYAGRVLLELCEAGVSVGSGGLSVQDEKNLPKCSCWP